MVPREVAALTAAALALGLAAPGAVRGAEDARSPECNGLWLATRALSEQGDRADADGKIRLLEQAIERGEEAVRRCPDSVEAHFWLGASYGRFADAKRGLTALRLVGKIRREMETSVRLQPDYDGGDAYLALGRLEISVPGLFGGSRERGVSWLEEGLRVAPRNLDIRLALAEAYLHDGRRAEATSLLRSIVDAPASGASSEKTRRRALELLRQQEPRAEAPPALRPGHPPGRRLEAYAAESR
jgi:tetratricopeptide (TPR) repeat protein